MECSFYYTVELGSTNLVTSDNSNKPTFFLAQKGVFLLHGRGYLQTPLNLFDTFRFLTFLIIL